MPVNSMNKRVYAQLQELFQKPHEIERHQAQANHLEIVLLSGRICSGFAVILPCSRYFQSCTNRLGDELRACPARAWLAFHSIQNIKFQSPLLPENRVSSRLTGRKNARF